MSYVIVNIYPNDIHSKPLKWERCDDDETNSNNNNKQQVSDCKSKNDGRNGFCDRYQATEAFKVSNFSHDLSLSLFFITE